jgi:hypothetical protein
MFSTHVTPPDPALDGNGGALSPAVAETELNDLRGEVAAANARADHLEKALASARRIGAAIGILMYRHRVTYEQGFDLLRIASQNLHRKLFEVAEDVLAAGQLPYAPAVDGLPVAGETDDPQSERP